MNTTGRNTKRGRLVAALTAGAMLVTATVSLADELTNTLTQAPGNHLETMNLTAGGSAGTTSLTVVASNGDGLNGCNFANGGELVVGISSSNTAFATVSPAEMTFTRCGSAQTLTVTPVAAGTAVISVTETSDTTRSCSTHPSTGVTTCSAAGAPDFNLQPASFNAVVAAASDPCATRTAPTVAPTITPTVASDSTTGWYNIATGAPKFTVSPATDAEYSSNGGTSWTPYSGEVSLSADGSHEIIARNYTPATTSPACPALAGPASAQTTFNVDRTAPTATPANEVDSSWHNTSLSKEFTFSDSGSGLQSGQGLDDDGKITLTASSQSASATTPTFVTKTVLDVAGNSTTRSVSAFIDLTKPTNVQFTGTPRVTDGQTYASISVPSAPTGCTADDALSGIPTGGCVVTGTYSTAVGQHTLTATATDRAGNQETATLTYTVVSLSNMNANFDGTGIVKAKAGQTLPLKWTISGADGPIALSGVVLRQYTLDCSSTDGAVEGAEVAAGQSGLIDQGAGSYQYNWQSSKTTTGCRRISVQMNIAGGGSVTHTFQATFTK